MANKGKTAEHCAIVPVSWGNLVQGSLVGARIFPRMPATLAGSLLLSLLPSIVRQGELAKLTSLEYHLAVVGRRVVGLTGLYVLRSRPREIWIGWFGVAEAERGKGYGTRVFDWTISSAKERGFDCVRLWTTSDPAFEDAKHMYERRSFFGQELPIRGPDNIEERFLVYSLADRQADRVWDGPLEDALLGVGKGYIARGQRNYEKAKARESAG